MKTIGNTIFAILILVSTNPCGVYPQRQDVVFGDCVADNRSCRDCYRTLTHELLKRDDNIFKLSEAFFPPDTNPPEFVAVTYCFKDNGGIGHDVVNESQTWYWVEQSSFFLFPPDSFQYLSLFFGKPEEFYAQEVSVTLNATDCLGVKPKFLKLLTQRLKAYVQRQSYNPVLDNSYNAKAGEELEDILDDSRSESIMNFIYTFHAFVLFLIILLVILMLYIGNYHKLWLKKLKKLTEKSIDRQQTEALLLSITVISVLIIVYIIILDALALRTYIINTKKQRILSNKLFHVTAAIFVCDIIVTLVSAFLVLLLFCSCCSCHSSYFMCIKYCYPKGMSCKFYMKHYVLQVLIIASQIIIFVTHMPFISIAYLNDAYHAGSIFIFYIVSLLLFLSVIEVSYHTFKRIIPISIDEGIQLNCDKSKLKLIKESDENNTNLGDGESGVVLEQTAILDFKEGEMNNSGMKVEITLQDSKVVTGKLTNMHIQLKSPTASVFEKFTKLENDQKLLLECTLVLPDKKEIDTKGACQPNKCKFITPGEVRIDECEFYNDSGIIFYKNWCKTFCVSCQKLCIIVGIALLCLFTLCGIVLTATYLVLIPINRSISDGPNRLIGVYNTLFLIIGVYIAYKAFFTKKISLRSAIINSKVSLSNKKNDDQWLSLSKEEKLAEFYHTQAELIKMQATEHCTQK